MSMESSKCSLVAHDYKETGDKELCVTCTGKVFQKVRICSKCGDRIVGPSELEKILIREKVKERKKKEAAAAAKPKEKKIRYVVDGIVDPIQDPNELLPRDEHWTPVHHWSWNRRLFLKKLYKAALAQMASIEFPKPEFNEDFGVIIVGGDSHHGEYGFQAAVALHMLYTVCGYKGYAEWHYRSERESVDPELIRGLADDKIRIRDLKDTVHDNLRPCGWSDKSLAMLNPDPERPFRYALRLDADAYTTKDPTPIFEQLKNIPIMFWSEGSKVEWDRVWPSGAFSNVPGIQGGQIFVDRKMAYDWLVLSNYIDNHREFYYPDKNNPLIDWWNYGDQGAAQIALTALQDSGKLLPYKVLGLPRFVHNVHEYYHHGQTMIVHRVRHKLHSKGFVPNMGIFMEKEMHACLERCMYRKRNSSEVFGSIYKDKKWQAGNGSLSGPGSEIVNSLPWIDYVNEVVAGFEDPFVLDLGCGDGNLTTRYNIKKYLGLDVVLARGWPDAGILRKKFDFWGARESMPWNADVWLMKDVLQHWPDKMVSDWLDWAARKGKFKKLLVCHDLEPEVNHDILLGQCRGLHWQSNPMKGIPWKVVKIFSPSEGRPKKVILVFDKGEVP